MDEQLHQILLANDSTSDWERPRAFDWQAAWAAVLQYRTAAELVLGQPLQMNQNVQDASHFTELFVFEDGAIRLGGVKMFVFKIAIRFSSFGRMATIYTNSALSDLEQYPVQRLVELLVEHGFVYIPMAALAEPYDGVVDVFDANFTWWLRYFDYM